VAVSKTYKNGNQVTEQPSNQFLKTGNQVTKRPSDREEGEKDGLYCKKFKRERTT